MIAEVAGSADPMAVGIWMVGLMFFVTLLDRGFSIWRNLQNTPQKREVAFAEEYTSKTEFRSLSGKVRDVESKLDRELAEIRREMKEDRETILAAGEERAVKLHERINAVLTGVSRLEGRLDK